MTRTSRCCTRTAVSTVNICDSLIRYKSGSKGSRLGVLKRFFSLPFFHRALLFSFAIQLLLQYIRLYLITQKSNTTPPQDQDNIHKLWAVLWPLLTFLAIIYSISAFVARSQKRAKSARGQLMLLERLEKDLQYREMQSLYAAVISLVVLAVTLVKRTIFRWANTFLCHD